MGSLATIQQETFGTEPFLVHDPETAWIVESGKVDLFLVPVEEGKPEGARSHVFRVGAGHAVLGMPLPTITSGLVLRAIPTPDARIINTSLARLIEIAGTPERSGAIRMLEGWIANLSAGIADVPPRDFELLTPGGKATTGKEPRKAVPDENATVWVRQTEGVSRFLGSETMAPITLGMALPLCSPLWLGMEARSAVEAFDTSTFMSAAGPSASMDCLALLHEYAMRQMVQRYLEEQKKETARLQAKADVFAGALDNAFHVLAAPLSEQESELPGLADGDALLAACQAIGKSLHINFKQHPDARRGRPQKDPIANIARASSVRVRRVVLDGNWWKSNGGPLLGVIDEDKTPVALLQPTPSVYEIYNPRTRTRTRVNAKAAGTLGAYAWIFYRPFEARALNAWDLAKFGVAGAEGDVRSIILMGIATGLLAMVTPIFTGFIFDTMIPGAQRTQLLQMMMILIACGIGTALFSLTRNFAMLRLEGQMDAHIQSAVWDRLLSLPVPFFRDYNAGDLAMRSLGINAIRQILTGSALSSILAGVFSIFSFFLLFYYSWKMAMLASGLILIAVLFTTICGYTQIRYQREVSRLRGHISGMVLQFISGISKFRISGTEDRAFASWSDEFSHQKEYAFKARKVNNYITTFNAVFPVICSIAIFYMMAWMLSKADTALSTTGQFLAFNAAFGQFLASALGLSASLVSILAVIPHYERAAPILKGLPEVNTAKSDPGELTGGVEATHIAFRYRPDAPLVLRDVSFSIRPGEFVAFVGPSGSGKSTLFRMLLGFETPDSGAVFYDGQELSGLDIQAVRRQMGVVLQNGKLLTGDIFTNIVGSAPLTTEEAWEAARLSGFEQDVKQMPMGMHTVVSEGGGGLSGGQRQRLLIARAIVGKPRILLFDEATSALDNQTQAIVSRSLEALKSTRIVIAHRLSTVINADRIFVIDKGVVAQVGSYEELIKQEGLFAELAKRQLE